MLHPVRLHQGHAVLGPGHEHGAEAVLQAQGPGGIHQRAFALDRAAGGEAELVAVRRHQVRPGIDAVVQTLGVHHHLAPGGLGGGDQALRDIPGQHPLAVIGEYHHPGRRDGVLGDPQQPVGEARLDRLGILMVGAEKLLPLRDEAGLGGGGPPPLHQQPGLHTALAADQRGQVRSGLVVADHGQEGGGRAERRQVAHHVPGAAGHGDLPVHGEHGDRRLGRDPGHATIDEAVQHRVAHHEDRSALETTHGLREVVGNRRFRQVAVHAASR